MREQKSFEPFDRVARRRARDRAARLLGERTEILRFAETEMCERAAMAGAVPDGAELRIGLLLPPPAGAVAADPSFALARRYGGVQCDEDRLPFGDARFARISCLMTLHGVNDLPGALVLLRRSLVPGGRLVAVLPAGIALPSVRRAFLAADSAEGGAPSPRVGPTIDPAEAGGLLTRAGFVEPVAEVQVLKARYNSLVDLAHDVRAHGDSGWLTARSRQPMRRQTFARAAADFATGSDAVSGRVEATIELLFLSGRAPDQAGK